MPIAAETVWLPTEADLLGTLLEPWHFHQRGGCLWAAVPGCRSEKYRVMGPFR
jgi:hypothetical protein